MTENIDDRMDELELAMQDYEPVNCPLTHVFTPGLYSRTIFMPAGTLITSQIHKTEHQFVISLGVVQVKNKKDEWETFVAPYFGITKPGTRRTLLILEDCVWTTFHSVGIRPENESEEALLEAVQQVEDLIIDPRENPLLGGRIRNNIISQSIDNQ